MKVCVCDIVRHQQRITFSSVMASFWQQIGSYYCRERDWKINHHNFQAPGCVCVCARVNKNIGKKYTLSTHNLYWSQKTAASNPVAALWRYFFSVKSSFEIAPLQSMSRVLWFLKRLLWRSQLEYERDRNTHTSRAEAAIYSFFKFKSCFFPVVYLISFPLLLCRSLRRGI